MKGLELPINIIIIIAVAVLVLVVVSAFFIGNFSGNSNTISLQEAMNSGCINLRAFYDCKPDGVNSVVVPNYKPKSSDDRCNLAYVCDKMGIKDGIECAKRCGCTIYDESPVSLSPKC